MSHSTPARCWFLHLQDDRLFALNDAAVSARTKVVLHQLMGHVLTLLKFQFSPSLHHVCTLAGFKFASSLHNVCTIITLGLLISFSYPFQGFKPSSCHTCFAGLCQGRFWPREALNVLPRARDALSKRIHVSHARTMCKPKCMIYMPLAKCMISMPQGACKLHEQCTRRIRMC